MPKFKVTVYDRVVRKYVKIFDAEDEDEAESLAEDESVDDEGWEEHYDEMLSEQCVESVEPLEDETDAELEESE